MPISPTPTDLAADLRDEIRYLRRQVKILQAAVAAMFVKLWV